MDTNRRIAVVVGALFITATVADLISRVVFVAPILSAPDYLARISANQNQVLLGAFFLFIGAVALSGIAIAMYPVLRKHDEGPALGSVGFRLIEGALYLGIVICLLLLVTLSQESANAGAAASAAFQVQAALLMAARECAGRGGRADLWPRGSHVLLGVLSIATRPSMAVRVGSAGHHLADGLGPARDVPGGGSDVDDPDRAGASHRRPGDGPGRLADRQGLRSTCHRCRVGRRDVAVADGRKQEPRPEDLRRAIVGRTACQAAEEVTVSTAALGGSRRLGHPSGDLLDHRWPSRSPQPDRRQMGHDAAQDGRASKR